METETPQYEPSCPSRRTYAARGIVIGVISLAAAFVAGLLVARISEKAPEEPALSAPPLRFTADDKEQSPLIGANNLGDKLPDRQFALLEGGMAALSHYQGKPLVINFFASTCPPCIEEMPAFESVHQKLGDEVNFLGVSLRESAEDGKAIVERTKVTYDIIRDPSGSLANDLDVVLMPSTILVSDKGFIIETIRGALTASELENKIKTLKPSSK